MTTDPHKITREGVNALRQAVERYVDRRIKTPADFSFLADAIRDESRLSVSATTLKRIWGYINDTGKEYLPGRYSLCVLSRFIGFRDYESFLEASSSNLSQSAVYMGETVDATSLPKGTIVSLTWQPDRMCTICSLGEGRFKVTEALNTKLIKGDIVECASFTQNAPLYFNRVSRAGEQLLTYVAGSRTGIHYEII